MGVAASGQGEIDRAVIHNAATIRMANMGREILGGFVELAGIELGIVFELASVRMY
jgi:hypothetical protein